ncbi:single-stranded DNA-binding protein [Microbacterium sp. SSM24]|uniref:single-stranded DNA-binding protein n=1 Tax=Microbacterium sp. SSM24 TaxID=2991714 RepID=UPI00222730AF|nr:single-stranded DNA-binding protein [Microbacterium sp. SSM24]MCW3494333.1 single-stranded DNA-binding protein [Microbacterium sp. SSM24]
MNDTITITGNLANDPELKHTQDGLVIASFRVGSGRRRFDKPSNAWVDAGTNWYAVSAFRSLGEHVHASLRRGDRVVLTGRLRIRSWENGTARGTAVEIEADAIGHDLMWGTTVFTKVARASAPVPEEAWEPTNEGADAWAAPGNPAPSSASPSAEEPRPLALVGTETPF